MPGPSFLRVQRKKFNRRLWSAEKFRVWCQEYWREHYAGRRGARVNYSQIARDLEISQSTCQRLYEGQRSPTLETFLRMCAAVGVSVDTWLDGAYYGPRK